MLNLFRRHSYLAHCLNPLEWKPITGSLVVTEGPYEMTDAAGNFIRVCTVWLDAIQVLHHAVPGLSLICSQDGHHRYKLIK